MYITQLVEWSNVRNLTFTKINLDCLKELYLNSEEDPILYQNIRILRFESIQEPISHAFVESLIW